MPGLRIMHYVNQFFAGLGAEDKANVPVGALKGISGPGRRLQRLLGDSAEIVVTAYCGDDYFAASTEEALGSILKMARDYDVKMLIAGPAFASGRYGFACAEVCHAVSNTLGLECISAMHIENPGVEIYRGYKDNKVFIFPTTEVVSGMEEALSIMAQFASRRAAGTGIGTPAREGYIPRGFRLDEITNKRGAARAVEMLLDRLYDRPFVTEIPVESLESIPVPARITNLAESCVAIITTSGVIPPGNPDGFRGYQNTKWGKHSVEKLNSMLDTDWDVVHGGYNTEFMKKNPNYGVPLDALKDLERAGTLAKVYPYYYVVPGARGLLSVMHRIGKEMMLDMKANGVDAAILVST